MKLDKVEQAHTLYQKLKNNESKLTSWEKALDDSKKGRSVAVQLNSSISGQSIVCTLYSGEDIAGGKDIIELVIEKLRKDDLELRHDLKALGVEV